LKSTESDWRDDLKNNFLDVQNTITILYIYQHKLFDLEISYSL